MYAANGHDKKYAAAQWMEDALVEHGGRWKSMMITWREKAREGEGRFVGGETPPDG